MQSPKKRLKNQILGFAVTGTLSTLLMLVVYTGLNKIINYQYAYLSAYSISVIVLYFMNSQFVFKDEPISSKTFIEFLIIYLVQYFVGAVSLEFIIRHGFSPTYAPVLVVILLLPVTFVLNRIVLLKH
jgi:putative flippase GtrA